jgi:hypothetical protein
MRRTQLGLLIVLFFASSLLAEPAQVIIIRHAEKPEDGNELSLEGRERAAALAPYFLANLDLLEFGPPVAIYAQAQKRLYMTIRANRFHRFVRSEPSSEWSTGS